MPFLETSAKETLNVEDAFVTMTKEIREKVAKTPGNGKVGGVNTPGGPGPLFGTGKSLP